MSKRRPRGELETRGKQQGRGLKVGKSNIRKEIGERNKG